MPRESRPELRAEMTCDEFQRWYWLRSELAAFARTIGVSAAGGKEDLTARIAAALDGGRDTTVKPGRRPTGAQLDHDLTLDTVIPAGQRSSQALRSFFVQAIGPTFHFDGHMRDFIRDNAGSTLADAVAHWWATRSTETTEIGAQFEFNRFTRQWHTEHPGSTRAELLTAWREYRSLPKDGRSSEDEPAGDQQATGAN